MNRRTYVLASLKLGLLAAIIAVGLIGAAGPRDASAQPIYPNKGAFQAACEKLGGTYTNLGWFVACTLPNGHIIACDDGFSTCQRVDDMALQPTQPGSGGNGHFSDVATDVTSGVYVESTPVVTQPDVVNVDTSGVYVEATSVPSRGGRIDRSTIVTPEAKSR